MQAQICSAAPAWQVEDEDTEQPLRLAEEDRLRELLECIQANHIQPPVRQQIILDLARAFAKHQKSPVPPGFSARLSAENDPDRLYEILHEELTRHNAMTLPVADFDRIAIETTAASTYGGIAVIQQKDHNVNSQIAANRYVGIGVQVSQHPETKELLIQRTIEGGSAAEAGITGDDIIESVEGRPTKEVPLNQVVDWLRGPEGTTVKVTVRNSKGTEHLEIIRRVTPFKTVQVIPENNNPDLVILRPDRIGASTVHELTTLASQLSDQVKTVVVDLRSITSGSIHHLHLLADALMDEGVAGYSESRTERRELRTEPGTFAEGRSICVVYIPRVSSRMDWLATTVSDHGVKVFHEAPWVAVPGVYPPPAMPETLESFPVWNGTWFVEMNGVRLLLNDLTTVDTREPVGISLAANSTEKSPVTNAIEFLTGTAISQQAPTIPAPGTKDLPTLRQRLTPQRMTDDDTLLQLIREAE